MSSSISVPKPIHASQRGCRTSFEMDELDNSPGPVAPRTLRYKAKNALVLSRGSMKRTWAKYIHVEVPLHTCRDHLALERTYLAYVRTASAFALFGVAATQLFRLQGSLDPSTISSYYRLGKPVGLASECIAIVLVLMGAAKWVSQQQMMLKGKIKSGGWEMIGVVGTAAVLFFVLTVLLAGDAASGKPV